MPWVVWLAGWLANKYIRSNLTKIALDAEIWLFDTVDNILPYAEIFNEFVNTLFAAWTSGTFPNVVYFEPHDNFYRWDFPRPYTVEMPHFPQAFVASQTDLLCHNYKTVTPFIFYDVADLVDNTLQTDQLTQLETKSEPIDAALIMSNVWDKLGDRERSICCFGYTQPLLGGGSDEVNAFPYNNCVRWEQYGGWSYKAIAFKAFRKFSPFKSDGAVYLRGNYFYEYDLETDKFNILYGPRNPHILFDDYGTLKRNETESIYFEGQTRAKSDNSGLDVYRNGQWHHLYFFSNV